MESVENRFLLLLLLIDALAVFRHIGFEVSRCLAGGMGFLGQGGSTSPLICLLLSCGLLNVSIRIEEVVHELGIDAGRNVLGGLLNGESVVGEAVTHGVHEVGRKLWIAQEIELCVTDVPAGVCAEAEERHQSCAGV